MQENYKILNVSENASDEEIKAAYNSLKTKFSQDRFLEGAAGNEAAKNLTKVENAYNEIMAERAEFSYDEKDNKAFSNVAELIKQGKYDDAQRALDDDNNRNAEWHYLQSVIFYKKNWNNESRKQLEIAVNMDPGNQKYKDAFEKLNSKTQSSQSHFHSGNANYGENGAPAGKRQMGGEECGNMANCCTTWCCLELLCSGCCR